MNGKFSGNTSKPLSICRYYAKLIDKNSSKNKKINYNNNNNNKYGERSIYTVVQ